LVQGEAYRWLDNGEQTISAMTEEATLALRTTFCTSKQAYIGVEAGYLFDFGPDEFDRLRPMTNGSSSNYKYGGMRYLNPPFFRPLELSGFYSHFDKEGRAVDAGTFAAGIRAERKAGFVVTLNAVVRTIEGERTIVTLSPGARAKWLGISWNAAVAADLTSHDDAYFAELGMLLLF
jgi:hypothetical protein